MELYQVDSTFLSKKHLNVALHRRFSDRLAVGDKPAPAQIWSAALIKLVTSLLLFITSSSSNMAEETGAYKVSVLLEGYSYTDAENRYRANGTCTLVTGKDKKILVDTGSPRDKRRLLEKLKEHNIAPEEVSYVVCTHGHVDHVGNLNLFSNAVHMVSHDILQERDVYVDPPENFNKGAPHCIDSDNVQVISTPGHTHADVSVVVRGTEYGTVVICGDVFEHEGDDNLWEEFSEFPEKQRESRKRVLEIADWIVPGHGEMFKVDKSRA